MYSVPQGDFHSIKSSFWKCRLVYSAAFVPVNLLYEMCRAAFIPLNVLNAMYFFLSSFNDYAVWSVCYSVEWLPVLMNMLWKCTFFCRVAVNLMYEVHFIMLNKTPLQFTCYIKCTLFCILLMNLLYELKSTLLAGIACRLERQTCDHKVANWNPGRSGWRIFFPCQLFMLTFVRCPFHPCVTTVARKRPQSFWKKCRWQVIPKHAYILDPLKPEWADYAAVQA